jgi:Tfp pilus assembly protein PilE
MSINIRYNSVAITRNGTAEDAAVAAAALAEKQKIAASSHGATLKKALLKYFGILAGVTFLILMLTLVLTVVLTNIQIKSRSETELESQIETQAHATLSETGDYLIQFLNNYEQSVVNMVAKTSSNTLREDYTLARNGTSYFDYGNEYLSQPLSQDSRQIKAVSFSHSSYYVTGSHLEDVGSFPDRTVELRNATANVDTYYKHAYTTNAALVATYTGFNTQPDANFFRHYPGTESLSGDPGRTYDPVERPWYQSALDAYPASAFTAPYGDAFGKGWLITGSRVITDYASDNIIGVAGADILIKDIRAVLDGITFLKTGVYPLSLL